MESRQSTPSVIARLMGLDDRPPQQPVQKKQRVLSENYLRRVASIGVREKRLFRERKSFRLSIDEHKEFKDGNSLSVSADKKLHILKDEPRVIDIRKDLVLKFSHESDYLFAKPLHDLHGVPYDSQLGQMEVVKSFCSSDCGNIEMCRNSGSRTEAGCSKHMKKVENGLAIDSRGELTLDNMNQFSRSRFEANDGSCLPTTRIVVLKPNTGKVDNSARFFSSLTSSHEVSYSGKKKRKDFLASENGNLFVGLTERKNLANQMEPIRVRPGFSREIIRQMGHGISGVSTKVSRSRIRGSHAFSKDSTSLNFSDLMNVERSSFYQPDESYVTREPKKKILERWQTTRKFQEVRMASKCRALGQMLALPDYELRLRNADNKFGKHYLIASPNKGDVVLGAPSGIGKVDNWKDQRVRDLARFRSRPANSVVVKSPTSRTSGEALNSERCIRLSETGNWVKCKLSKQDNLNNGSKSKSLGSGCKVSASICCLESENLQYAQDTHVLQNEMKNELEEMDLPEQNLADSKSSSCSIFSSDSENSPTVQGNLVIMEEQMRKIEDRDPSEQNSVGPILSTSSDASVIMFADATTNVAERSFGNNEEQLSEPGDCDMSDDESSSHSSEMLIQQDMVIGTSEEGSVSSHCSGTERDSLVSLEETYQPSPNSVLEAAFKNSSGHECFKNVDANLNGFELQLEFLKSELSETQSEGPGMILSSDEDCEEGSIGNFEESEVLMRMFSFEESRDFSYLVDILTKSGFLGRNVNMDFQPWHSADCPISLAVFESLEKKYGEQTCWMRSERRLLFDRINSALLNILQPNVGLPMQAKSIAKEFRRQNWELIEEELWIMLVSQGKQASRDSSANMLGKDERWLELGDDIEMIGREIENSLIDEMVGEVFAMETF